MQFFSASVLFTLIYSAALSLAVPGIPSLVSARSQHCANFPNAIAGSTFNRRTQIFGTPIHPTPKNIVWCRLNSQIYINLDFTAMALTAVGSIELLLFGAIHLCQQHILAAGDGVIQGGRVYTSVLNGLSLELTNANNHQLTWSVAAEAVKTMLDYMHSQDIYGQAVMWIHDGGNVVGQGVLEYNPQHTIQAIAGA